MTPATAMADAAARRLATLGRHAREIAHWPAPGADPATEAERQRW